MEKLLDYKKETKKAYDEYPTLFADKFSEYLYTHLKVETDLFIKETKNQGKVLDLGAGSGEYALYFKRHGLDVICVDFSEEMLKICKERA